MTSKSILAAIILAGGALTAELRDARACATVYPPGSFVELTGEETLIVWDAEKKTEHFVRTPTFEGDPTSFGFFVPTPVTPAVAKVDPDMMKRVVDLFRPPARGLKAAVVDEPTAAAAAPPTVEVTQRVMIDDYELVSLKATDATALGQWLAQKGFADKPSLRAWMKPYVERGYIINAMRYAGTTQKKQEALRAPTLRMSFTAERPFYPYMEPERDELDARGLAERNGRCRPGAKECRSGLDRKLDVYVVSHGPVRATIGDQPGGPLLMKAKDVLGSELATALDHADAWGFDPLTRERWTVTHFEDTSPVRSSKDDVIFAAIGSEVPPPRVTVADAAKAPATPSVVTKRRKSGRGALLAVLGVLALGLFLAMKEAKDD